MSNGAPPQRPVPDERLIAVVERAAAELIEACAEEDARITEAALMAAARDCVGATSEGALRLSVCQEEACCVIGLGSRRVPEGTDDHGDWVIVRAPLQIDDYVDRVYWIADDGRIELMCRWPPYVAPECQAEDGLADDLDSTGCAGSPREWAELGEATRRFLCQSAI